MAKLYEVYAEHDQAAAELRAFNRARLDFCEKAARLSSVLARLEKPEEAPKNRREAPKKKARR